MIDLHAHVLPGIDDGPADVQGSLALLEAAARDRTRVIAATPHLRGDFPDVRVEDIAHACQTLQERIPPEWELRVVAAAEVDLVWALDADDDALRLASYGQRGTDLLVETPYGFLPAFFEQALRSLAERGFRVLLAHPELNQSLQQRPERLSALVAEGVLLQLSAGSLLRSKRSRRGRLARHLVGQGLAHVLGSDAHTSGSPRPPGLSAALAAARLIDARRADWMVSGAPAAILAGESLPPLP